MASDLRKHSGQRRNVAPIGRARDLRRNETEAERQLWQAIRARRLDGAKFRRQVPIGPYILDFVCFERRLIVEVDGGQHMEQVEYDTRRTKTLTGQGYYVLRFWNNEIIDNLPGVLEAIRSAVRI